MSRHRAPRSAGVFGAGVAVAAAGLALLVVPAAPIEARSGTVLDHRPETTSATTVAPPPGSIRVPVAAPVAAPVPTPEPMPEPTPQGFVPDRVVVEALGVDAPLITTLVDEDGAFVPPEDPGRLGWWRGVRPGGGSGSVVVAGHIDSSRYGQGPLARLVDLVPGDRAMVSGPDGSRQEYAVRGVQTFPKASLPAAELFGSEGEERLVLVTCGGTFDRRKGSWDSNIVAVLDPMPSS